jgi:hypothetical protein
MHLGQRAMVQVNGVVRQNSGREHREPRVPVADPRRGFGKGIPTGNKGESRHADNDAELHHVLDRRDDPQSAL